MGDDSVQSKLFGRYQEVVLLVIGFVLTSVVGGFLGGWFQARSWRHEHSVQQCESEKETATKGAVALSGKGSGPGHAGRLRSVLRCQTAGILVFPEW